MPTIFVLFWVSLGNKSGMTWMSPYYAMLNGNAKSGRKLVGSIVWRNWLIFGMLRLSLPILSLFHMVLKFREVFPTDLHGMPPDRDIDFCIDLETGIRPFSIPPYRMALAELRELKAQIQGLLDKGIQLVGLRKKEIKSVKVQWKHRPIEEAT
ncbi:hypothetical protein MTR67_050977 [Solanum verrucosum]|uniref:Uncharacterized protein n=1 Tax=Solanum verrucosum TaxID=315347 RepID=A0AAF0V3F6_SOLVR|nr:hypothetical protein MTR67_050977 [Solanum verrucosum]